MFTILMTILAILASLCGLFYKYLTFNFNYWKKRNVIGPEPMIWTGNFPSVWNLKVHQTYEFDKIYQDYKGHPYVGVYTVRTPKLFVLDPELIKEVLIKNFKNFQDNEFRDFVDKSSDPLFGRNPFVLHGEEWKEKRAEISPAFTTSRIRGLSTVIDEVCLKMTKYVKQQDQEHGNHTFDARELMSKYTTDVVASCAFAVDAKSFEQELPEIREMGRLIFQFSMKSVMYFSAVALFPFINKLFKVALIPPNVNEYFQGLMKNAVAHRKENKIERNDYLDHVIKLGGKKDLDNINMAGHAISFFADGFETSSIAMTYTLYEIARHEEVQKRLRKEILDKISTTGEINYDNISELPYLEQVLSESLRLHPQKAVMIRKCTETTEIVAGKDKKVSIEKGTSVIIPYYSIHVDPDHYADPFKFDPERFSPEKGGTKPYKEKGVYYIFSDGPRMCVGIKFAMAQLKRGIVEIVKNFEMSVNQKTQEPFVIDPYQFFIMPTGGIWLNLKPIV